jgi:hypothetical protein
MTETDYIVTKNLGIIGCAKAIVRELYPELTELITEEEHATVMAILTKWEIAHYSAIKTEPAK